MVSGLPSPDRPEDLSTVQRALGTSRRISALLGPNPRVVSDGIWAKLLWVGLNETPAATRAGDTDDQARGRQQRARGCPDVGSPGEGQGQPAHDGVCNDHHSPGAPAVAGYPTEQQQDGARQGRDIWALNQFPWRRRA